MSYADGLIWDEVAHVTLPRGAERLVRVHCRTLTPTNETTDFLTVELRAAGNGAGACSVRAPLAAAQRRYLCATPKPHRVTILARHRGSTFACS